MKAYLLSILIGCCFCASAVSEEVWTGGSNGISWFDVDGNFIRTFTTPISNNAIAVVGDRVWTGGGNGISWFDSEGNFLRTFTTSITNNAIAVVPEPGSVFAFMFGVLVVVRRLRWR